MKKIFKILNLLSGLYEDGYVEIDLISNNVKDNMMEKHIRYTVYVDYNDNLKLKLRHPKLSGNYEYETNTKKFVETFLNYVYENDKEVNFSFEKIGKTHGIKVLNELYNYIDNALSFETSNYEEYENGVSIKNIYAKLINKTKLDNNNLSCEYILKKIFEKSILHYTCLNNLDTLVIEGKNKTISYELEEACRNFFNCLELVDERDIEKNIVCKKIG